MRYFMGGKDTKEEGGRFDLVEKMRRVWSRKVRPPLELTAAAGTSGHRSGRVWAGRRPPRAAYNAS